MRKSKRLPDVYLKKELIDLALAKGLSYKQSREMKKKDLCEYLKLGWVTPLPREPSKAKTPKGGLLILDGRPCNTRKSKLRPTALPKAELVELAVLHLGYSEVDAMKKNKGELCRELIKAGVKAPGLGQPSPKKPKKKTPPSKPLPEIPKKTDCISRSKLELHPHQRLVVEYLKNHRGAIAAHDVGSGKTLLAVTASQCILDAHPDWRVVVLTSPSLQENFKKGVREYGADPDDKRYLLTTPQTFANRYNQKKVSCDKKTFLIVDEAHNLRTDIAAAKRAAAKRKSKSKKKREPSIASDAILRCAKQVGKVLLLTATPIYNSPMDIANLVAMVKGEEPLSKHFFKQLLDNDRDFNKYFECVFSFYKTPISDDYPTKKEHNIDIIMTPEYYAQYKKVEEKNFHLFRNIDPWLFLNGIRQATNALDPCQKCQWAVNKIKEGQKTVLYSAFITHGVKKIQNMLDRIRIPYVQIVGNVSQPQRVEAVKQFNDPNGPNVLFITKAGAEGLDLKRVKNIILLEAGWCRTGEEQVIGRAVRYKSHVDPRTGVLLPKKERHVNIYHLSIIKPIEYPDKVGSADEILRALIEKKKDKNDDFKEKLKYLSIERSKKC